MCILDQQSLYMPVGIFSILQFQNVGVEVPKWTEKWDGQEKKNSWFSLKINFHNPRATLNRATIVTLVQVYKTPVVIVIPALCHAISLLEQSLTVYIHDQTIKLAGRLRRLPIKTLLISRNWITLLSNIFLALVYINHKPFQGFIWLILAEPRPSWRSLYSDRSQTLQAIVAVFPHDRPRQDRRYCKTEIELVEI